MPIPYKFKLGIKIELKIKVIAKMAQLRWCLMGNQNKIKTKNYL